jgi:hypothetical protein
MIALKPERVPPLETVWWPWSKNEVQKAGDASKIITSVKGWSTSV